MESVLIFLNTLELEYYTYYILFFIHIPIFNQSII